MVSDTFFGDWQYSGDGNRRIEALRFRKRAL
jgi:hypothetical protein